MVSGSNAFNTCATRRTNDLHMHYISCTLKQSEEGTNYHTVSDRHLHDASVLICPVKEMLFIPADI